jgi:hypothetical protein
MLKEATPEVAGDIKPMLGRGAVGISTTYRAPQRDCRL